MQGTLNVKRFTNSMILKVIYITTFLMSESSNDTQSETTVMFNS